MASKGTSYKKPAVIQPLFLFPESSDSMGEQIIQFTDGNYNKADGITFIDAKNDAEAISAFLHEFRDSPETLRSYAKEIERLLLWCIHKGKTNISSLNRNHLIDYQAFIKNPQPKKLWCGSKMPRLTADGLPNPNWRPFNKGLADTTSNKAKTIIDSFFNYLVQTNYLTGNPLAVDRRRKRSKKGKPRIIVRYLELDEIHAVLDALAEYPVKDAKTKFKVIRARYIVLLLFYTGLRIAEAANHNMGKIIQREENWFLRVIGKGNKLREIPVPDELLEALADFRLAVGLPSPQPKYREKTPLIPMENLKQPISTRRIDQILKWAFKLGSMQFEIDKPRKASKLRSASAHWLRHSYVTYLLDAGAPLKVAQENAGHSDIRTTMHYRHVSQTDRHEATKILSLGKRKKELNQDQKDAKECQD